MRSKKLIEEAEFEAKLRYQQQKIDELITSNLELIESFEEEQRSVEAYTNYNEIKIEG